MFITCGLSYFFIDPGGFFLTHMQIATIYPAGLEIANIGDLSTKQGIRQMENRTTDTNQDSGNKKISLFQKMKNLIISIIRKIRFILNQIYLGEETYSKVTGKLINAVKVFIVSTRKFLKDGGTTKASSIAYATIVSLIPTLTVAITFYSIFSGVGNKKEELFRKITLFMLEHNIRLNIDPVIDAISNLIDNAGKIGGVGAVIMVFSATAVLRTVEQSLNDIWGITTNRPFVLRIIYYWAALTLGPLMLIAGTTVATQISTTFSSTSYYSAHFTGNRTWLAGNKATLEYTVQKNPGNYVQLGNERIDFDNQRIYTFDAVNKSFIEDEFRLEPLDLKKFSFHDVQFIGKRGWAVGKNGIVLTTENGGDSWIIWKWGSLNFNDIHMLSPKKGFVITDNGYLLSTDNGGRAWTINVWEGYSSSLNHMTFSGEKGIVTGNNGVIITTSNEGGEWSFRVLNEAKQKNRYMNLNNVAFATASTAWLVGDQGVVLKSDDSGKTWTNKRFQEKNYHAVLFLNKDTGFIAGDDGILIKTTDGGSQWQKKSVGRSRINHLATFEGRMWLFGNNGLIKYSGEGDTWRGEEGRSFIIMMLNFFAPFLFIWLLFLLTYIHFPNTRVPFKPAAIGAAFTGAVWVIFILLFIVYVKYFSFGQLAIYGALAAIPIFLLMVYASALITLYGAEVSYTLMYPHTYLKLKKAFRNITDFHVIYGIIILHHIYGRFEEGKGASTYAELTKLTSHKNEEVDHYLDLFKKEKLILENETGVYMPTNSSKNVLVSDIIEMIHSVSLTIPSTLSSSNPVKKHMQKIMTELEKSRAQIIGKLTLAELISE